jgi:hypothetical protein
MQRIAFAILGLTLTAVGAWMSFVVGQMEFGPILFRSGLVLSALALALPQIKEFFAWFPPWLLACGAVGLLIIIWRPRMAVVVLPVLVALWFLGPRRKKSAKGPARKPAVKARR